MKNEDVRNLWNKINDLDDFKITRIFASVYGDYMARVSTEEANRFFELVKMKYDDIVLKKGETI